MKSVPIHRFAVLGSLLIVLAAGGPKASASELLEINSMKAVVNGEVITSAEVDAAVGTQIQVYVFEHKNDPALSKAKVEAKIEEFKKQALSDLIDRKLILAKFAEMDGSIKETYVDARIREITQRNFGGDEKKFLSELAKTGMSIRQFRENQRETITVQALRGGNDGPETIINTPDERLAMYEKIKGDYATDVRLKVRKISIQKQVPGDPGSADAQKRLAEDILRQLKDGQDFATMARTHSADSSAAKGGLVGEGDIDRNFLAPKLSQIAFSLPVGKVSDLIDDGNSWRIMHVDARSGGVVPPFEELEETCDKLVTQEKRKGYVDRWLEKLRHEASIRVFE